MKRIQVLLSICTIALALPSIAAAKEKKPKPGPLTGTWECMAKGGPQGDTPFTLYLDQVKANVSGSVSSPLGSTDLSGIFKKKKVEIRIDSPQGAYVLSGKYKKDQIVGEWAQENGPKGTWEGKKSAQKAP